MGLHYTIQFWLRIDCLAVGVGGSDTVNGVVSPDSLRSLHDTLVSAHVVENVTRLQIDVELCSNKEEAALQV